MNRSRFVIALVAFGVAFALLGSSPAEAASGCGGCQECRRIGIIFPIYTCWNARCAALGGCGCVETDFGCQITGYVCYNDCITVY